MRILPNPELTPIHRTIQGAIRIGATLALLATAGFSSAEQATVRLNDGTVLKGEVVSLKGGDYTIRTQNLGDVKVDQNKVDMVSYGSGSAAGASAQPSSTLAGSSSHASPSTASAPSAAQMQAISQRLLSDPNTMTMMQSLAQDPAMQAVIQDPDIQRAIQSGDFASLMNNPKIKAMMNNSTVRKITQQVK